MDDLLTSYREAIESLFARTTGGIKPGLERTNELLARLGDPHKKLNAIHVAGTNGKGSVVATCEALLRWRGLRVGRYTSPHLIDFRERITVDGKPISEAEVLAFLERWIGTAEELGATFFEVTTALAFDWLAKQNVDVAVIETGLGGRLDSTNVLSPQVATVTSIGLDHTDLLGSTLEGIAREKGGIFKRDIPAVIGEPDVDIQNFLAQCASEAGAVPVTIVDRAYSLGGIAVTALGTSFRLRAGDRETAITTPLIGSYQARNTTTAIATLDAMGGGLTPPPEELTLALSKVFLPGRFQRHGKFIFDVAHNPAAARTVADNLVALNPVHPRTALLAVLGDKDWRGFIDALAPVVDRILITNAPSAPPERRWNADEAHAYALAQGVAADLEPDLDIAIVRAQKRCGTLLVTGSFHTVGDVMSRLQVSPVAA
ncbi:MAG TPA: folylpolyglutamate synthase/dihydrofolate synthase family protein [Gemmatimonadaceae bacterium]|nr:folylpolyglutamate synthase/dihydrofolate synthase family protein [Gemmatimonadaceae bacterium]